MAKNNNSSSKHSRKNPQFNSSGFGNDVDVNEQDGMDNAADGAMNEAQNQLQNARGVKDEIKNAPENIKNTVNNVKNNVNNIKNAPKNIKNVASNTIKATKNIGNAIRHPIQTAKESLSKVPEKIKNIGEGIKNTLNPKRLLDKINPLNKIKRKINEVKKKIQKIKDIPKKIKKAAENAKKIAKAIKNIPKNIQRAIKAIQKAIQLAIKTIKAAVQAAIKLAQLTVQLIQLLIQLIIATWPIWVIALILGVIIGVIWWILDNDSTSDNKSYNGEQTEYNETKTDENGNATVISYSGGTKVVEAFYQYFAEKSLWVVYDGVVHNDDKIEHDDELGDVYTPIQYNTEEFDEKFRDQETGELILVDAEGRESMFYINPNALFVFDKYLHGQQIRFPEQIVQHVAYDYNPSTLTGQDITEENDKSCLTDYDSPNNRFILKQLTEENDEIGRVLNITSQKYKKVDVSDSSVSEEFRTNNTDLQTIYVPDGDEKEIGVWDYGLGSILHYEKYLVKHQKRGSINSFEVWDKTKKMNEDGTIWYGENKLISSYKEYRDDTNKENYDATTFFADLEGDEILRTYTNETDPDDAELADEDTYFIDWVVTPAGDIVNDIVYDWKDSGDVFNKTETEVAKNMENYKERIVMETHEYNVSLSCTDSSVTVDTEKLYPRPIRDTPEGSIKSKVVTNTQTFNAPSHVEGDCDCDLDEGESCSVTHHSSSCSKTYTYTYNEEFIEYWNGSSWQRTPCTWKTNENINAYIQGTRWDKKPYYDGEPDMTNFTGKRYYEDYLSHYKTWVPSSVSGFFNYTQMMKRINAANDEDLDAIIARSNAFGNGANSLMGGIPGAGSNKFEQCYNGTYKETIDKIWDGLISWGYSPQQAAGILGNMAAESTYNPEAINSKSGASGLCQWLGGRLTQLKNFANSYNGTDWIDLTSQIQFACMELDGENSYSWASNQWAGHATEYDTFMTSDDPSAIAEAMMRGWERPNEEECAASVAERQASATSAYETLKDRTIEYSITKVSPSGAGTGGGSSSSSGIGSVINSIWSWLKGVMDVVREKYAELFGRDTYYNILDEKERFVWNYHPVQESDIDYVLQSIFAYSNGKVISEYYGDLDAQFNDYYTILFSNPIGSKWYEHNSSANSNETVTFNKELRDKYYPDGYTRPLDECVLSSKTSQYGVYFKTTDSQNVYSVSDGEVYLIGEDDRYDGTYILIKNGASHTIYGNLKEVKVSEGQTVSKGQIIATVDGSELFFGITNTDNVVVNPQFILPGFADIDYYFPTVGPFTNMPVISQSQDAVRDYGYGSSTLGKSGCGICAFAMVISSLNDEIYSPMEIADTMDAIAKSKGLSYTYYYTAGVGSNGGVIYPELSAYYGLQCQNMSGTGINDIISQLDKGRIVIVSISKTRTSLYRGDGHFIVIRGHVGDKFYINDSKGNNGYKPDTLYSLAEIGHIKHARAIWK